jgi:hypothetical protein
MDESDYENLNRNMHAIFGEFSNMSVLQEVGATGWAPGIVPGAEMFNIGQRPMYNGGL